MQTHIKKNVLTPSVFSFINDDKKNKIVLQAI